MNDVHCKTPDTEHGGQIYAFGRQAGWTEEKTLEQVLDFSASIHPLTPKIDWEALLSQSRMRLPHYPDQASLDLKTRLGEKFSLAPERIAFTNGISSAIMQLFAELRPSTTVLFTPIYGEYLRAAQRYAQSVIELPAPQTEEPISDDTVQRLENLPAHSLVVLVNPGTPHGQFLSPSRLEWLRRLLEAKQAWLVIDESFLPFIGFKPNLSFRPFIEKYDRLLILQSLTKYYSCPGVRIGAVFSQPETLSKHFPAAWPVSVFDEQYLVQALQDPRFDACSRRWLKQAKASLVEALTQLSIVSSVEPGFANFVLVRFTRPVSRVAAALHSQGILIRDCRSFGYDAFHARIAVKRPEQNVKLIEALKTFCEAGDVA